DKLVLYGSGTFNLNSLAGYSGIEEVELVNYAGSTGYLYLRNGSTSAVSTVGTSTTLIYTGSSATFSAYFGGDGSDRVYAQNLNALSGASSIDGGNGTDFLYL